MPFSTLSASNLKTLVPLMGRALKIFKISVSIKVGLPLLLGLTMRYHIEKLEFQKIGNFPIEPSSLLLKQNGGEMSPGQVSSAVLATLGGDNYRIG